MLMLMLVPMRMGMSVFMRMGMAKFRLAGMRVLVRMRTVPWFVRMRVRMGVGMRMPVRVLWLVLVIVIVTMLVIVREVNIKFHALNTHLLPSRKVKVITLHAEFAQLALELCGIHPEVD